MAHRLAHFADKAHIDRDLVARVNSAVILGLIGGGLVACAAGAALYDIGRLLRRW